MKSQLHDLEQLQQPAPAEQVLTQQDALSQEISNISDVARCHEDGIDDTRAAQDFTHELVLEREQKGSRQMMII